RPPRSWARLGRRGFPSARSQDPPDDPVRVGQAHETLARVTMGMRLARPARPAQPSRSRACAGSASYNLRLGTNQFAESGKKLWESQSIAARARNTVPQAP